MKLLFLDNPAFGKPDMIDAFKSQGASIRLFNHEKIRDYRCKEFDDFFDALVAEDNYDAAFSFNYYPAISNGCNRNGIKYLSFVYDNPLVALYSYTLINPCNYVFIFDKACFMDFANGGIETVYYMPLCANTARLSKMTLPAQKRSIVASDVSFVGSLYNEDHNFYERMTDLDSYSRGYIDALINAQRKVNGYSFIEEALTPNVVQAVKDSLKFAPQPGGTESDAYICANYVIARKLTSIERESALSRISERYHTKLYTHNPTPNLPKLQNMGAVDYYEVMPHVFKNSKINLNITLRSIRSGIPLRAFDIMGCGGFLLTNFQPDLLDIFVPDEDFVFYDGEDDLLAKIEYYLTHEKERTEIARNGFEKVKENHTYHHRAATMLEVAELIK